MVDPTPRLERFQSYEEAIRDFRWHIPERFNFAEALFRRHPDAVTRIALYDVRFGGANIYTFGGLDYLSDKFANVLAERGVRAGDYVGICAAQSAAAAVAELATLKAGAIALVPWSAGPSHLVEPAARLLEGGPSDQKARVLVLDAASLERINRVPQLVGLLTESGSQAELIFVAGQTSQAGGYQDFWRVLTAADSDFTSIETSSSSPAFVFLGDSPHGDASHGERPLEERPLVDSAAGQQARRDKSQPGPAHGGAVAHAHSASIRIVHSHASLISQLSGFEMANEFDLADGKTVWSPGDWSSPSILLGMVLPAWWYGGAVVAYDKALPAGWLDAIESYDITNAFLTESNLEFLLEVTEDHLRRNEQAGTAASGGPIQSRLRRVISDDAVDAGLRLRLRGLYNAESNVLHGPPEAPSAIATCSRWFETRDGWLGRAAPGWEIEVLDAAGRPVQPGRLGTIVIRRSAATPPEGAWVNTRARGVKQLDGSIWLAPEQI
jgi:acetyl-CoA synthetase